MSNPFVISSIGKLFKEMLHSIRYKYCSDVIKYPGCKRNVFSFKTRGPAQSPPLSGVARYYWLHVRFSRVRLTLFSVRIQLTLIISCQVQIGLSFQNTPLNILQQQQLYIWMLMSVYMNSFLYQKDKTDTDGVILHYFSIIVFKYRFFFFHFGF